MATTLVSAHGLCHQLISIPQLSIIINVTLDYRILYRLAEPDEIDDPFCYQVDNDYSIVLTIGTNLGSNIRLMLESQKGKRGLVAVPICPYCSRYIAAVEFDGTLESYQDGYECDQCGQVTLEDIGSEWAPASELDTSFGQWLNAFAVEKDLDPLQRILLTNQISSQLSELESWLMTHSPTSHQLGNHLTRMNQTHG